MMPKSSPSDGPEPDKNTPSHDGTHEGHGERNLSGEQHVPETAKDVTELGGMQLLTLEDSGNPTSTGDRPKNKTEKSSNLADSARAENEAITANKTLMEANRELMAANKTLMEANKTLMAANKKLMKANEKENYKNSATKSKAGSEDSIKPKETAPAPVPCYDPVAFFTAERSLPHIASLIMDYANPDKKECEEEDIRRSMMSVNGFIQAKMFCDHRAEFKYTLITIDTMSMPTIERFVRTMLRLKYATSSYNTPSSFGVSRTWRDFMLGRLEKGKHQDYAFRKKLEQVKQAILRYKPKTPKHLDPADCPECSAIFLKMVDDDLRWPMPTLFRELSWQKGISGVNVCARH